LQGDTSALQAQYDEVRKIEEETIKMVEQEARQLEETEAKVIEAWGILVEKAKFRKDLYEEVLRMERLEEQLASELDELVKARSDSG